MTSIPASGVAVQPAPQQSDQPAPAESDGPPARTLNWPLGGSAQVESRLGSLDKEDFPNPDFQPSVGKRFATAAAIGAPVGGLGFAALSRLYKPEYMSRTGVAVGWGIAGALLVGIGAGWINASREGVRGGDVPELAREDTRHSMNFDYASRPDLPSAAAVPAVEAGTRIGEYRAGISGSTIGTVVNFEQRVVDLINTQVRTTVNTNGEPTFSFGDVSGTETTYDISISKEAVTHNTLGLGKVLYDTDGYDSLNEAAAAYDGKHSVAIVAEGGRYFLADFDAEDFTEIGHRNSGMVVSDDRIKAIFTNKSVYYPTDLDVGPADAQAVSPALGNVFLFAHGQDIDQTVPASVNSLTGQPIGWYDTNAEGTRSRSADRFQLAIRSFLPGDEWSGPGFSDRAEAVAAMVNRSGNQALVHRGDRYYVADTARVSAQTGEEVTLDAIVSSSTRGAYIHGLRTMDAALGVEVLEEAGGLYVPVDDWWVRAPIEG